MKIAKGTLESAVRGVADRVADGDPAVVADLFWMSVHGAVSLELARIVEPERAAERFRPLMAVLLDGMATGG